MNHDFPLQHSILVYLLNSQN